jgi:hypothetical protein
MGSARSAGSPIFRAAVPRQAGDDEAFGAKDHAIICDEAGII